MPDIKMEVRLSPRFRKQYKKADGKIKTAFNKRLRLFKDNPHDPLLNNHSLSGKFKGFRSINITGDWRAIYSKHKETIIFELLGTHSQLYKH